MSSTTLPNLPVAISLSGFEQVWININGFDYRTTVGAIAVLTTPGSFLPALITSSGNNLFARGMFSVKTSLGAFSATLPKLSTVPLATPIWVQDIDNNAGVNNFTVDAFAGDEISDHGSLVTSWALATSNTIGLFLANTTEWTVIPYGF